jgi:hypothetical protein
MFAKTKPAAKKKNDIENVLRRLSSVDVFKVHGRMIDGNAAKTELGLNVHLLGKDDPLWKALWHYYVRADVVLSRHSAAKLIESRSEVLIKARMIVVS